MDTSQTRSCLLISYLSRCLRSERTDCNLKTKTPTTKLKQCHCKAQSLLERIATMDKEHLNNKHTTPIYKKASSTAKLNPPALPGFHPSSSLDSQLTPFCNSNSIGSSLEETIPAHNRHLPNLEKKEKQSCLSSYLPKTRARSAPSTTPADTVAISRLKRSPPN